jgi:hypothetical protein
MNKSTALNTRVKHALKSLNKKMPFTVFDLKLTTIEKNALNKIHIDCIKTYDNFGELNLLAQEVKDFLISIGKNDVKCSELIAQLISKLVNEITLGFNKETAWVTIRTTTPTNAWDLPRWHTDGYYYSPYEGGQYKIAIALKGPSTLFYNLSYDQRDQFQSLQFNPENREIIAKMLGTTNLAPIDSEKGVIFIVGSNNPAIHSEPAIKEERLFLSVVPGNKLEIAELYNNWHPK